MNKGNENVDAFAHRGREHRAARDGTARRVTNPGPGGSEANKDLDKRGHFINVALYLHDTWTADCEQL